MKRVLFFVGVFAVVCCNSAIGALFQRDSTVRFKVVDFDGNPISNAVVRVNTFKKWMPGEGFGHDVHMDIDGQTDANGETKIVFLCKSLQFSYVVSATGYYGEGSYKDINSSKAASDIKFARAGSGFTLRQTQFETNLVVKLKPIGKPIPMFVYYMPGGIGRTLKYPNAARRGSWGFDLKVGDWIKPNGKGEVADFFAEYSEEHLQQDKAVDCALVFTNAVDDGCYVAKCTGTRFRSDYVANTNAVYMKRLDFDSWGRKYKGRYATELLDGDEYLVIRTRTKRDEEGRIISANYAKIYGPISFCFGMNFISYFNPNENDPNLEADTNVNLMPGGGYFSKP